MKCLTVLVISLTQLHLDLLSHCKKCGLWTILGLTKKIEDMCLHHCFLNCVKATEESLRFLCTSALLPASSDCNLLVLNLSGRGVNENYVRLPSADLMCSYMGGKRHAHKHAWKRRVS